MTRLLAATASVLAAAALGAGLYAVVSPGGTNTVVHEVTVERSTPTAATTPLSVTDVYNRSYRGVVEITVSSSSSGFGFGGGGTQEAQGSGFVYDGSGHVITNQHVVDGAKLDLGPVLERRHVQGDARRG